MNAPIAAPLLYPAVPEAALKSQYMGTNIQDLPTPAAIIDRAVATSNCADMLHAARTLGLEFRPHVKTHKVGHRLSPSIIYGFSEFPMHDNAYYCFSPRHQTVALVLGVGAVEVSNLAVWTSSHLPYVSRVHSQSLSSMPQMYFLTYAVGSQVCAPRLKGWCLATGTGICIAITPCR